MARLTPSDIASLKRSKAEDLIRAKSQLAQARAELANDKAAAKDRPARPAPAGKPAK
jgi:hypothetical protein